MLIVDQQQAFAQFGVAKLDTIWKPRLGTGKAAFCTERGERVVRQTIKMAEVGGIEARYLV